MQFFQTSILPVLWLSLTGNTNAQLRGRRQLYAIPVPDYDAVDPTLTGLRIPDNAADVGMWAPLFRWPMIAVHAAIMPNGKILTFGAPTGRGVQDGRTLTFWNPLGGIGSNAFETSPQAAGVDSFCASGAILSDGQYVVSGGAGASGYDSRQSALVNYKTQQAVRTGDMSQPHWYGTMTKLPDGRVIQTGGGSAYAQGNFDTRTQQGTISTTPEIFSTDKGWRLVPGARSNDAFGADSQRWWYPRQWVSPVGTLFGISTEKMWELNVTGETSASIRTLADFKTQASATTRPNVGPTSTAVMYAPGLILQVGGNGYSNTYQSPSSDKATVIDIRNLGSGNVGVRDTYSMTHGRQWANAVVLPDGKVSVTGGSSYGNRAGSNDVRTVELWDPVTEQWQSGPDAAVFRGYHSTAVLLPSGSVLTAGGGVPGPSNNLSAQIFLPSYMFRRQGSTSVRASRPRIRSMSSNSLDYNGALLLQVTEGANIREVSLIALPSTTHSFDSNQRRMTLNFSANGDSLTVSMPENANLAPPGYYYLNIVDTSGVPSTAVIIAIASDAPPRPNTERTVTPPILQGVYEDRAGACRTANGGRGNEGSDYVAVGSNLSKETCQSLCDQRKECVAIEYSTATGTCENWFIIPPQTNGQGTVLCSTKTGTTGSSQPQEPLPAPTVTTVAPTPGPMTTAVSGSFEDRTGACRTANDGTGTPGNEFVVAGSNVSKEGCQLLCERSEECVAYEYTQTTGFCENWNVAPPRVASQHGSVVCGLKTEATDTGSQSQEPTGLYQQNANSACRTDSGTAGSIGREYDLEAASPQSQCEEACSNNNECRAYEYNSNSRTCELWKVTPTKFATASDTVCNVKT